MEVGIMRTMKLFAGVLAPMLLAATLLAGCDDGPAERAGERIDKAVDKLSGKGPAEKAGERIDEAAKELTKKK
jgi:predicted small secreted protein